MTTKIKPIRQIEDLTKKIECPQKIQNLLSKEAGETMYNHHTMLHAEKEREKKIAQSDEGGDTKIIHAGSLPTMRIDIRPVTAPGKVSPSNQPKPNIPARPQTVQEERHPNDSKRPKTSKGKTAWGNAFQKIKIVQSISGGIQIEGARPSRLQRRQPTYQSPPYAFIKPKKIDVKQPDFSLKQAQFWAEKFKELTKLWEKDGPLKKRLRDILPRPEYRSNRNFSPAHHRYNEFMKNHGSKYKWAFIKTDSPMADEESDRRLNYVPIRHFELAEIQDDMHKRQREISMILQRSNTIHREVQSLTRLKKQIYEPDV